MLIAYRVNHAYGCYREHGEEVSTKDHLQQGFELAFHKYFIWSNWLNQNIQNYICHKQMHIKR